MPGETGDSLTPKVPALGLLKSHQAVADWLWQRVEVTRDLTMSSNGSRCHARPLEQRTLPAEQPVLR